MTRDAQVANVLGALALAVADRSSAAIAAATGQSTSSSAALSALHHFLDRPTIDQLRRVLGLTPSGAVRLVDRLADAGLVTREPGGDGRSRAVTLTPRGRLAAERVADTRAVVLTDLLADLTADEREALWSLLGRVMATLVQGKAGGPWICRLCDLESCGRDAGQCPAANAAAARYGPPPRSAPVPCPRDDEG